jgi:hypothetical protein
MKGLGMTAVMDRRQDRRRSMRRHTVVWIVGLATVGLMFDGYDLVAYGAVMYIFRRSPAGLGRPGHGWRHLRSAGWRGMFWTGAPPVVTLLPPAIFKMRESPARLAARSGVEQARAIAERTGMPIPEPSTVGAGGARERVGFADRSAASIRRTRSC